MILAAVLVVLEILTWISYYSKKGRFTINLKGMYQGINFRPYFQVLRQKSKESWIEEEKATESRTDSKRMQDEHYKRLEDS